MPGRAYFRIADGRLAPPHQLRVHERQARYLRRLKEEVDMLYTLAVILLIAWLLGIVGTYTIGAFVHVLLVIAIVLFVVQLLGGRRTVA
jgi:hypothetical protein